MRAARASQQNKETKEAKKKEKKEKGKKEKMPRVNPDEWMFPDTEAQKQYWDPSESYSIGRNVTIVFAAIQYWSIFLLWRDLQGSTDPNQ